jgi:hypothetical protein
MDGDLETFPKPVLAELTSGDKLKKMDQRAEGSPGVSPSNSCGGDCVESQRLKCSLRRRYGNCHDKIFAMVVRDTVLVRWGQLYLLNPERDRTLLLKFTTPEKSDRDRPFLVTSLHPVADLAHNIGERRRVSKR